MSTGCQDEGLKLAYLYANPNIFPIYKLFASPNSFLVSSASLPFMSPHIAFPPKVRLFFPRLTPAYIDPRLGEFIYSQYIQPLPPSAFYRRMEKDVQFLSEP